MDSLAQTKQKPSQKRDKNTNFNKDINEAKSGENEQIETDAGKSDYDEDYCFLGMDDIDKLRRRHIK